VDENKLSSTFEVTVNGDKREIFMSYGLLTHLVSVIGDATRVPAVVVDGALREAVMKALLAKRKPSGKIVEELADYDDLDIEISEVENLLAWAQGHVLGFFLRALEKAGKQMEAFAGTMASLQSLQAGLTSSASKTP
jgi:hypothetical protein